jgi:hypothetical protein
MNLECAAHSPEELRFLRDVVADLAGTSPKYTYANWLESQGDLARAKFMRDYANAYSALDSMLMPDLNLVPALWSRIVGATVLKSMLEYITPTNREQLRVLVDRIFGLVRPTLSLCYDEQNDADRTYNPPIGRSFLFGYPDLPTGTAWPTFSDCLTFTVGDWEFPGDDPCRFIGQLNLSDIAGAVVADRLPSSGLLSFFANIETEEYGTFSICVKHTSLPTELFRAKPPSNTRADNLPVTPRKLTLTEQLSLPDYADSPWENRLRIDEFGDLGVRIYKKACAAGCTDWHLGFFGHLHGTTGSDPSPDCEHLRFASIRVSADAGIAHLAIRESDLRECRTVALKYVWLDWDS